MGDTSNLLLLTFAGGLTGFLLLWLVGGWFVGRRQSLMDRRIRSAGTFAGSEPSIVLDDLLDRGGRWTWWGRLKRRADEWAERTDLDTSAAEIFAVVLLIGAALAALVYFWRSASGEEGEEWMAIPAFLVGVAIPLAYFNWRAGAWRKKLQEQLPDMIFLMARSLRAGQSLDQSFRVLGDNGVRPLSREFGRMHNQLEVGLGLNQVLQNAADRIRLTDFNVFASVLSLYRATGGNLAVIVDRLANTIRDHNKLRQFRRTATALGRVTVPLMALLVLVALHSFFFESREYAARYFESPLGLTLFLVGLGLVGLGLVILYFMTRERLE